MFNWKSTLVTLCLGVVSLTACSGTPSNETTAPSSPPGTTVPCGKECSGEEVAQTHCNQQALDAVPGVHEVIGDVSGTLVLRKANPAVCTQIFWAHFHPDQGSKGSFTLTIRHGSETSKPQASQPGNPELEAYTVGVYADLGEQVQGCLTASGHTECVTTTVV